MPSLTSVPATCAAPHTATVHRLPSTWFAPNNASAISTGQASSDSAGMNADATRVSTGSCSRLSTLVLAQRSSTTWSGRDRAAQHSSAAITKAR